MEVRSAASSDQADEILRDLRALKAEMADLRLEVRTLLDKMSHHIDWVDSVYASVRNPLNYLRSRLSGLAGGSDEIALPTSSGATIGMAPHSADQP